MNTSTLDASHFHSSRFITCASDPIMSVHRVINNVLSFTLFTLYSPFWAFKRSFTSSFFYLYFRLVFFLMFHVEFSFECPFHVIKVHTSLYVYLICVSFLCMRMQNSYFINNEDGDVQ